MNNWFKAGIKQRPHQQTLLPVQTVDHVSHSVDEILVFLWASDNDAMELLHVRVNGFKGGRLSTTCRATSADQRRLQPNTVLAVLDDYVSLA